MTAGTTCYMQLLRSTGTSELELSVFPATAGMLYGRPEAVGIGAPVGPAGRTLTMTPTTTGWHPVVVSRASGTNANTPVTYTLVSSSSPVTDAGPGDVPARLEFAGARSNPAVGPARIEFSLSRAGHVKLAVYAVDGRLVRTLVDGDYAPGAHGETWDLRSTDGATVGAGVYWLRLDAEGRSLTRRMITLR
jgi:hypothetical protein